MTHGFDCSELTKGFTLRLCTESNTQYHVTDFGGLINMGKGFTTSGHTVTIANFYGSTNEQKHDIAVNILNNLFDLTTNSLTSTIRFTSSIYNLLSAEEKAIGTNKGWTVQSGG